MSSLRFPFVGRARRGAVLVMATAMTAGLMVIAAIAVDLSRLYVMRTELQTTADAAALAAAMRLTEDRWRAGAAGAAAVSADSALGDAADVDSVRFGLWQASARSFVRTSGPIGADAVQVSVSRATTYLIGRFISGGPVRVTARATAWAGAPAMRADCVTPWFILHHDYMEAFGRKHEDMLTHDDIRTLRDTATNKRWITVKINRRRNAAPDPNWFYGMVLPSHNSGREPQSGQQAYRRHITECTTMERGWVAKVEESSTVRSQTWPGLQDLCQPLAAGVCYNRNGTVGVPITVSVFCKGPEHTGGDDMWFQVEWMTGLNVAGGRQTDDFVEITGYLIPTKGTGEINWEGEATGLVRTILVR